MKTYNVSFETTVDGLELRVDAVVMPARRGNLYGKPEDCYPDEPAEVEEVHVFFDDEEVGGKIGDYLASQIDDETIFDHMEEDCAEDYA